MPRNIRTRPPNPRRLTIIKHVLDNIPHESAPREKIVPPKRRKRGDCKVSRYPFRFIPETSDHAGRDRPGLGRDVAATDGTMNKMSDVRDFSHFSRQVTLRDGTPVLIRAIRPDDVDKVVVAFHELDPQSVYTRFFSYRKELKAEDLDRLGGADFVNSVVLVVAIGAGADEVLIGGVSYHVRAAVDGTRVAELAFTIEEDYQGQGLASKLLALVTDIARSQGISQFEAEVLASNSPMLSVFHHSGLPMTESGDDGLVHVMLDLVNRPPPGPAPGSVGNS